MSEEEKITSLTGGAAEADGRCHDGTSRLGGRGQTGRQLDIIRCEPSPTESYAPVGLSRKP
eukprot:5532360-Pyramimonas_sp.AAC.2